MTTRGTLNLSEDEAERLGCAIMVRRTVLRMDRRNLAEKSKLSYPYTHQIESGRRVPSPAALRAIADVLGVTDAELLTLAAELPSLDDARVITGPVTKA